MLKECTVYAFFDENACRKKTEIIPAHPSPKDDGCADEIKLLNIKT
jgi:hypothetical protein